MSAPRVVRDVGAAVRPRERWTPSVHLALEHLRARGFREAPEPIGFDSTVERVAWIDGEAGADGWRPAASHEGLVAMAELLRRLHRAGEGFALPADLSWADLQAPRAGPTLCHGDFGPWNLVWRAGRPVGVNDWDLVHLGDPEEDLRYALEYVAPFREDEEAIRRLGHRTPPDRPERIARFWRAYTENRGAAPLADLVDGVIAQQRRHRDLARRLAAEGVEPQATWMREGFGDALDTRIAWSTANRSLLVGA